jgi:hypothetical protein
MLREIMFIFHHYPILFVVKQNHNLNDRSSKGEHGKLFPNDSRYCKYRPNRFLYWKSYDEGTVFYLVLAILSELVEKVKMQLHLVEEIIIVYKIKQAKQCSLSRTFDDLLLSIQQPFGIHLHPH